MGNSGPSNEPTTRLDDAAPDFQPGQDIPTEEFLDWPSEKVDLLQLYVWDIRDRMGLHEWEIFVARERSADNVNASVHVVLGRRIVPIHFNQKWWDFSPESQRNTVVHELLHVVHHFQTEVIRLAPRGTTSLWGQFNLHTEYMVDHLAGIIDQFMPLPEQPVTKDEDGQ